VLAVRHFEVAQIENSLSMVVIAFVALDAVAVVAKLDRYRTDPCFNDSGRHVQHSVGVCRYIGPFGPVDARESFAKNEQIADFGKLKAVCIQWQQGWLLNQKPCLTIFSLVGNGAVFTCAVLFQQPAGHNLNIGGYRHRI
jgi:hypothetical protein